MFVLIISFGVNLLQYGLCHKRKDIIKLANAIIKIANFQIMVWKPKLKRIN